MKTSSILLRLVRKSYPSRPYPGWWLFCGHCYTFGSRHQSNLVFLTTAQSIFLFKNSFLGLLLFLYDAVYTIPSGYQQDERQATPSFALQVKSSTSHLESRTLSSRIPNPSSALWIQRPPSLSNMAFDAASLAELKSLKESGLVELRGLVADGLQFPPEHRAWIQKAIEQKHQVILERIHSILESTQAFAGPTALEVEEGQARLARDRERLRLDQEQLQRDRQALAEREKQQADRRWSLDIKSKALDGRDEELLQRIARLEERWQIREAGLSEREKAFAARKQYAEASLRRARELAERVEASSQASKAALAEALVSKKEALLWAKHAARRELEAFKVREDLERVMADAQQQATRENAVLAHLHKTDRRHEILAQAQAAGANRIDTTVPAKVEELLGSMHEMHNELSGIQTSERLASRQRNRALENLCHEVEPISGALGEIRDRHARLEQSVQGMSSRILSAVDKMRNFPTDMQIRLEQLIVAYAPPVAGGFGPISQIAKKRKAEGPPPGVNAPSAAEEFGPVPQIAKRRKDGDPPEGGSSASRALP